MRMPGFTAGVSLCPAVGHSRTLSVVRAPSDAVLPQMDKAEMYEFMRSLLEGPGEVAPPWEGGGGGDGGGEDGGGGSQTHCLEDCYADLEQYHSVCKDIYGDYSNVLSGRASHYWECIDRASDWYVKCLTERCHLETS
jgi:hypothetical protein